MACSIKDSAPAKRPWPFDPCETSERRPAFHVSSYTLSNEVTSYQPAEYDAAGKINWQQGLQVPAPVSGGWSATDRDLQDGNYQTATAQNDFFSSRWADMNCPNSWNNQTGFQTSDLTRNDYQGPEQTPYGITTHYQSSKYTDPSAGLSSQGIRNTSSTAQPFIPLEYTSLASIPSIAQSPSLNVPSDCGLLMNDSILEPPNLDTYGSNGWLWDGAGDEKELPSIEVVDNTLLQIPDSQSSSASLERLTSPKVSPTGHETSPQPPARIGELSESIPTACFGTICDINVQLLDDPIKKYDPFSITSDKQNFRKLVIVKRDHYYAVQYGIDSVTYEAVADTDDLDRCVKTWKKKSKMITDANIEINIYGPLVAKEEVGKLLSAARHYLQQPRLLACGILLDNPHTISFPNLAVKSKPTQLPTPTSTPARSSFQSKRVLYEVLEGLDHSEHLKPVHADSRITAMLLKYQHKITGKRKQKPLEDIYGSILADEMGLGKTLMMLATILATLGQSNVSRQNPCTHEDFHKRPSGATLVIAPSASNCCSAFGWLDGWMAEVERHIGSHNLRVHKYHGHRKETDSAKLAEFDIVLTTYFHAVASLSAKIRWCLTGTPIQNKLEDLGALVRFLRVPFVSTSSEFRNHFVQPIQAGNIRGFENLRTLLNCICIRRTKDLLQLPDHRVVRYELHLSPDEKSRYSQILASHKKAIDDSVCGRKPSDAYRTIFQALLQLRMLCNHGSFQTVGREGDDRALALLQEGAASCAYCNEDVISDGAKEDSVAGQLPACSHLVCQGCIQRYEEDLERLDGFRNPCK
ncbi:hypothetical protein AOQ84DRAFT_412772 [Glonium stellatum]|uniref:SNF2 N-terminal domain-containing protein n=1 Tax=Glonium stellatum TaxID=574774 RepID=A0A8E2EWR2_9PEZI|nr:hypothetical protein AOQ84DRAFT_412772 [Glonium stellatum]